MRIGFIGGNGHHYLRGLLGDAAAGDVTAAVGGDGVDDAAAEAFAVKLRKAYPGRTIDFIPDGRKMLDGFKPDLVNVGAVYGVNGDWSGEALRRNIATVTDKPAAASRTQLQDLKNLVAADPSRVLLTEFDFRSRRTFRAARGAVKAGRIGRVILVTGQKSYRFGTRPAWYADREKYGGLVLWIACHTIDAIDFVTGLRIERAVGRGGNLSRPEFGNSEDHVTVLAELAGGATAALHADFGRPRAAASHGDDRLRVVGSEGVIEIIGDRCLLTTHDAPEQDLAPAEPVEPIHRELLAAARGRATDLYSTVETLRTAAVLLAVRDAVDRQAWTTIAPARE